MPKVAAIAKLTAQPGKRDELVAAFDDLLAAVAEEPGTELYVLNVDAVDADTVWFYELYTDQDSLAAHGASDAMKAAGTQLGGLLAAKPELHFLTPQSGKGVSLS